MQPAKPGERIEQGPLLSELDFDRFRMRVSTDRYVSRQFHQRERERLWMKVWQVAGRVDELPATGHWLEYTIFDRSFLIVRGRDDKIRGFVNACRHRGNILCEGRGHSARFVCPYHRWSYDLDGSLLAVAKPEAVGPIDLSAHALLEVPVECFAGFIFLNPDPEAGPLAHFLGEVAELLAPYRLDEMTPVGLNVRENLDCNWKVIMDAFAEGYHVQGIHPELLRSYDDSRERYCFFGDHTVATGPFGSSSLAAFGPEREIEGIRELTATFPGIAEALPLFDELVDAYRDGSGSLNLPKDVTPRTLLQRATRDTLTAKGLDVSGLTDTQMSDNQFYLLFPNFFLTIRAGEAVFISSVPHPDGDPNRCRWHVTNFQWLPPDQRQTLRADLVEVDETDHFDYFLALEQDYQQMQRQQRGLRNRSLTHITLAQQEVRLAHFHSALDRWLRAGESV